MEIKFWVKDAIIEGEIRFHICTLNNVKSNPFKVGDVISLEMFPLQENGSSLYFHKIKNLHLKKIKLVEENKYLNIFNELMTNDDELIIEYNCEVL